MEHEANSLPLPSEARIENGWLIYEMAPQPSCAVAKQHLLEDFLDMGSAAEQKARLWVRTQEFSERPVWERNLPAVAESFVTPSAILKFVTRWGVLGLCKSHHLPLPCQRHLDCRLDDLSATERREPLQVWQNLTIRALLMRRTGEELRLGKSGHKRDWQGLIVSEDNFKEREQWDPATAQWMAETGGDFWGEPWKSKRSARERFSELMNNWLRVAALSATFGWFGDRWGIRSVVTAQYPLFGQLALYLASAVAGGWAQSAWCSFCGGEYWPKKQPAPGQTTRCKKPECRTEYFRTKKQEARAKQRAALARAGA